MGAENSDVMDPYQRAGKNVQTFSLKTKEIFQNHCEGMDRWAALQLTMPIWLFTIACFRY